MRRNTINLWSFLVTIGVAALLLAYTPLALAQKATATPKPSSTPKPSNTPKPTATPKPPFDYCFLYPSPTPRKNITPSKTPQDASESLIVPSSTPVVPTGTPAVAGNATAIPTGHKPADALIRVRQSPVYQRAGKACVVVYEVVPGGPAALAGIRAGDLILGVEKTTITEIGEFYGEIVKRVAGDVVKITIQRDGTQSAVSVTLGLSPYADPNATDAPTITPTPAKK